ncbi:MAG: BrnA antitoxin family protein [Bryobacteraceae bacterium]
MRSEYDFSRSRKNPYVKQLKRQVTIRLDITAVDYFKQMAAGMGMPYQNLINLFLRDCAARKSRPTLKWTAYVPKRPAGAGDEPIAGRRRRQSRAS